MRTYIPKAADRAPQWHLVDARDQVLGRLASRVARILMGKENPRYTPYLSTGEHVIIINAAKLKITGQKVEAKQYHHFTGYPGGLKTRALKTRIQAKPEDVLRDAIRGMLPKSRLGKALGSNLRVYAGDKHPHFGQQPRALNPNGPGRA